MSNDLTRIIPSPKTTLGDRIRSIANQLRQEDEVQIKATSRILGAAAQLAENHDRLIDEVVEMVEEDLEQVAQAPQPQPYTAEKLQQQFKSLKDARAHFNLKAKSWVVLVNKLNEKFNEQTLIPPTGTPSAAQSYPSDSRSSRNTRTQDSVSQRIEGIEQELQRMRGDINHAIQLLELLVEKLL
ncbi:hypothetical protein [Leptolyngbya sp. FACHB-261]|uniref:hypothetical protein n=1 Tax=Leptolyngbya sp. FACHB-261 TaxID=2692806 RepID=UPI0016838F72|nr:hypothetical protein [Leptolyngbya sp. FACHB-261]MBD2101623.1 hypothetical protein [Leptolyngbya sp. FACHB-261]